MTLQRLIDMLSAIPKELRDLRVYVVADSVGYECHVIDVQPPEAETMDPGGIMLRPSIPQEVMEKGIPILRSDGVWVVPYPIGGPPCECHPPVKDLPPV